jgi:hypothetical protein
MHEYKYRAGRKGTSWRFFVYHYPGNVTQSINPWTWFFNSVGSQFGLVNIDLGLLYNPAEEEEVLTDVASCGRRLGRIEDALLVLLAHFRPECPLTAGRSGRLITSELL